MVGAPPPSPAPAGIYLHFPFCSSRCSYCDFPSVAGRPSDIGRYLRALEFEILNFQRALPERADSLYIGGGTPSLMNGDQLSSLLRTVRRRFDLAADAEISLECNPEQVDDERLLAFREAGVTRLTIGMQSFDDAVLARAGRRHSAAEAIEAGRDPLGTLDRWHPGRRLEEALIMGLRLTSGLDLEALGERYGADIMELYHECWERACDDGLLQRDGALVRLTTAGMLHSNELFSGLIAG